jgi:dihydrofolate reductase
MKSLLVFSDVTVDGFMAGPDKDLDFMVDGPQLDDGLTGMLMSVADTIVLGRKAFSDMAAHWPTASGGLVTFGGVYTVRSLVAANLVDEYWLKINPAIVGRGGSMFSDVVERRALTLRSARSFPSGAVALIYST